ncbi:MAG TPA: ABC transporter ATP-binding protein [Acidimicrobiales bacterium]|nr:ABC transporter ATP-binding protein [Acidimicrobiales bacterium]
MSVLEVTDLRVDRAGAPALRGVSFAVERGASLGIVGPSGSGKTTLALAIMGLLPARCTASGSVRIGGQEMLGLGDRALSRLRGRVVSVVVQDPAAALNPVLPVGRQVAEAVLAHQPVGRRAANERTAELLERAGIPRPEQRVDALPSQLSGGQRQRVAIAIALANSPDVLIADEPFTDLDTVVAAQVLHTLDHARRETGTALVLITHDLALVADRVEQVVVMEGGTVVEAGEVGSVFTAPASATTRRLLDSQVSRRAPRRRTGGPGRPVLSGTGLVKTYPHRDGRAVDGVSLDLEEGRTLGLVGRSGSGKSSVVRMLIGLSKPTAGEVRFGDRSLASMGRATLTDMRRRVQVVFQDPYRSLDPQMTVARVIAEPLRIHGHADRSGRVEEVLGDVGLDPALAARRPHELSAGERQRVAIARALALRPDVLLLDEPVSSLDAVTQGGVLDLLINLQDRFGLTYLFVSHDLGVIRAVADRVAVMRSGEIVEEGPVDDVLDRPRHPYTEELINASPGKWR